MRQTAPRSTCARAGRHLPTPRTRDPAEEVRSTRRKTLEASRVFVEIVAAHLIRETRGAPPTINRVPSARRLDTTPEVPRGSSFANSSVTPKDRGEPEARQEQGRRSGRRRKLPSPYGRGRQRGQQQLQQRQQRRQLRPEQSEPIDERNIMSNKIFQ